MGIANILRVDLGQNGYKEKVDFFQSFHHSQIYLTDSVLSFDQNSKIYKFEINPYEKDSTFESFIATFSDDTPFRIIKPIGYSKEISLAANNCLDCFSIGSLNPDGYAIQYIITKNDDYRKINRESYGPDDMSLRLYNGLITALQNNTCSIGVLKRFVRKIYYNNIDVYRLKFGNEIAGILKENINAFDSLEQEIVRKL